MGLEDEIRADIKRGAALLDTIKPGWREKMDKLTFNFSLCTTCTWGQVMEVSSADDYQRSAEKYDMPEASNRAEFGFEIRLLYEDEYGISIDGLYEMYHRLWIEEIWNGTT